MLRTWYTSLSGMKAQETRMDTVANNLANVDLTGFKRDVPVFKSFPELLMQRVGDEVRRLPIGSLDNAPVAGKIGLGVEHNQNYIDFSAGSLRETDNAYDMALSGEGFFVVDTPTGNRYTRNGEFILGKEGWLETKAGYRVLGENGPLSLKANNFRVNRNGDIIINRRWQDSSEPLIDARQNEWEEIEVLDRLLLVKFPRPQLLQKQGNSLFVEMYESNVGPPLSGEPENLGSADKTSILWKFLEKPNVNPVNEMVNMIEVQRAYEANQKVLKTSDELLGMLINEGVRYA